MVIAYNDGIDLETKYTADCRTGMYKVIMTGDEFGIFITVVIDFPFII